MPSTIILSDNGASSGSAGLKQTAGNDGVLVLQTTTSGGTATNAVYVDTSQQLGFNTSSPAARLHANDTMASSTTYQTEMILQAQPASGTTGTSSAGGVQLVFRGTTDGSIANSTLAAVAGFINTNAVNNAGGLLIRAQESAGTGLVDAARVTSNGLIALRGATNLTSGTGIAFPATQSASSDANTLDDYEEGTFTPVIKFGSTTATLSSTRTKYTKVGNMVTCWFETYTTNLNGGTGALDISGLPFANTGLRTAQTQFFFQFMSSTFPTGHKISYIENNGTSCSVAYFTGVSGTSASIDNTHFTTSSYVYATLTYPA